MLNMTSKTNINNGYTCLAITIISLPLFTDLLQFIAFCDRKILIQQFVHVYFYIYLLMFERLSSPGTAMVLE